jgi:glucose/mannose-6-phosphate isomerase
MNKMLDDANVLKQRDRSDALGVAARLVDQLSYTPALQDECHDGREIHHVIVAGMGGSALAADLAKTLLSDMISIPFEVVKDYALPAYATKNTLVILSSHSGNTEETLVCFDEAMKRGCQLAAIATGGALQDVAKKHQVMFASIPHDTQPRMGMIYNLRALLAVLVEYALISPKLNDEIAQAHDWLEHEVDSWVKEMPIERNYAKQLALIAVGKTPVFYGGSLTSPVAYKWKISWNENAKNVAFWNRYPEFNHNEFLGWTSHPIEKPFVIFDIVSDKENPRILKRFELSDKLLSGRRPKAQVIHLAGDTVVKQLLWGCILADFVSIYVAIMNNVDPTQVDLIERFKKELSK